MKMSSDYYVDVYRRKGTEVTKKRVPRSDLQSAERYLVILGDESDVTRMVLCKRALKRDTVIKVWTKGMA